MSEVYKIDTPDQIFSPGLVVFEEVLRKNLAQMKEIAGDPQRLRPHCKTHKMIDIIRLEVGMGILKHKCATFAEAEMLALAGAQEVTLAYNPVGPNIDRAVQFRLRHPNIQFSVTADHPDPLKALDAAMGNAKTNIDVLLDINPGLDRTGLKPGDRAAEIYALINRLSNLRPVGFHVYDGHNHQTPLNERKAAVDGIWSTVQAFRDELNKASFCVPKIIAGGTGTFPLYAQLDDPSIELSPGTCVFHDAGYSKIFPDLPFTPAALILTRVISRPSPNCVTFDLGHKACAADPPAGHRLQFPSIPDAREILQNEEHLVIETAKATNYRPGDSELAIPIHICPTSALHTHAWVIQRGKVSTTWEVTARHR